jgi:hypothetical protein
MWDDTYRISLVSLEAIRSFIRINNEKYEKYG